MTCLTPASANATSIYYCIQEKCGELPLNPVFKRLRFTGGVPNMARDTLQSSELDGSAEVTGVRLGSRNVTSEQSIELSYGSHDDLLAVALQSSWVTGDSFEARAIAIDAEAKAVTVTGFDLTSSVQAGDLFKMPALDLGINNQPLLATTVSFTDGNTVIGIDAATISNPSLGIVGIETESATSDVIVNDKLVIDTERKRVALLVEYGDMDGGATYDLTTDAEVTGFSFNMAVNALVTGSLNFIGKTLAYNSGLPTGATLEDAPKSKSFTAVDGALVKDGLPLLLSTSIDITFDRNATAMFEIGSNNMSYISYGKATSTISTSTAFRDYALATQFGNEVTGDYSIIASSDGHALAFNYPTALVTGLTQEVGEGDVTQTAELQAYKGDNDLSSLIIRRV